MRSLLGPLLNRTPVPQTPFSGARAYGRGRAGTPQKASMDAMSASACLFSIITRTARATAKQSWHMHRPGRADDVCPTCECEGVIQLDRHPALSVLAQPNDFHTQSFMFEAAQQHADLVGEMWIAVEYLGTVPYELWYLRPDRVVVVTDPDEYLLGYIYVGPDGKERPLKRNQILSSLSPNPLDPYRGAGAVQTLLAQIEGQALSAEWNTSFYANGARPGGIVKLSRKHRQEEFEELVEKWNYNHRGVANAGRTAFLEDGDWIDVKPMSVADMQLVETSNLSRDTILLAFGASKFDVGILEDVNRASASAARADFGERMTEPRLDRWKDMLNAQFLPLFGGLTRPGDELVYESPVPADTEERRADKLASAQTYKILRDAGVAPESAASVAGLPEGMEVEKRQQPAAPPPGRSQPVEDGDPVPA